MTLFMEVEVLTNQRNAVSLPPLMRCSTDRACSPTAKGAQ